MLREKPLWTFAATRRLRHGYGRIRLLPEHVLGAWACIDRHTGRVLWERDVERPNAICAVTGGLVIATEQLPVGLMVAYSPFDCYALELESGRLRWTTHPSGECGTASAKQYFYPMDYDHRGAAAGPRLVEDGMCFCGDGRILDAATGLERGRISEEDVKLRATRMPLDPTTALAFSRYTRCAGVRITPGRRLCYRMPGGKPVFHLTDEHGGGLWSFDLRRVGLDSPHRGVRGFRLVGRHLYILAAELVSDELPPTEPGEDPPQMFRILTLDLESGAVCQEIPIGTSPLAACAIEAGDERGVLVSSEQSGIGSTPSGHVLRYFERRGD